MCTVRYRNIGCYNDHHFRERPLSDLLPVSTAKTDCLDLERLPTKETLDTWNEYIYNLVSAGQQKGEFLVNVNGLSDQCVTNNMEECAFDSNVCVGRKDTIYAYNLVARRKFGK
ncbi:hypothetical protein OS493_031431 [Desmophyllum pertusum]|uniref:Uncharacterized protein n=1 Tax=Desmophyllum pertusum TaxID=174260 RepID=A0A9W9ZXC4_9CNID|nr:hypothetical protein OS493_031431 [Desmophyllum pertusum]